MSHKSILSPYILVTGGTGFIGSHTVVELAYSGFNVIIVDTLDNSNYTVFQGIQYLTTGLPADIQFYQTDYGNKDEMRTLFKRFSISCVIHFAGYKCVPESIKCPLSYFHNNVSKTICLLQTMSEVGCKKIVFSSSATVYGKDAVSPIRETADCGGQDITNPYGRTKQMIECILADLCKSDPEWSAVCLRYFNPIGAHPSGIIGENPQGTPNNIFPYIIRVATGIYKELPLYGTDYPTSDGTCIRDFIHVVDLARAHITAIQSEKLSGFNVYNVGTGRGVSVKELIDTFETTCKCSIPRLICERRSGDIPVLYADNQKIMSELGWRPTYTVEDMCATGYAFAFRTLHPR